MVYTKAWTGHRNGNGVAVFGCNASLITCHVTEVLQKLDYLFYSLVSLLFPVSGKKIYLSEESFKVGSISASFSHPVYVPPQKETTGYVSGKECL